MGEFSKAQRQYVQSRTAQQKLLYPNLPFPESHSLEHNIPIRSFRDDGEAGPTCTWPATPSLDHL